MKRLEGDSPGSDQLDALLVVLGASVMVTSAWVFAAGEQRRAVVRGRTPVSIVMGRIWSKARPSGRR